MEENTTICKPVDEKGQMLTDLVDRYNYWTAKKNNDHALAYERLIYAFSAPKTDKKD